MVIALLAWGGDTKMWTDQKQPVNTKQDCIKLMSLPFNGLGNPVKRATIIAKINKGRTQIDFLQETHLSQTEHEKLKRFWFNNTLYSSYSNARKRGVAILIPNATKFEYQK